jgi:hypothetical protein
MIQRLDPTGLIAMPFEPPIFAAMIVAFIGTRSAIDG